MQILRLLLFPLGIIFIVITEVRNFLYNTRLLRSSKFDIPTIGIGNLSVGGTGKSPHVEYLIRLLKDDYQIATISRGYGRKTKGYYEVLAQSASQEVGDEPLQFKRKFPDVQVAVDENRVRGVLNLVHDYPNLDLVLFDDVFQHRAVTTSLSLLLTEYEAPFYKDFILPAGNLRELRKNAERCDAVIVTKSPKTSDPELDQFHIKTIQRYCQKPIFFSQINYGEIYQCITKQSLNDLKTKPCLLVTGIAHPQPLFEEIESKFKSCKQLVFADHHQYNSSDINTIEKEFNSFADANAIIITTEKDATRLFSISEECSKKLSQLPLYIQPISIGFKEPEMFNNFIYDFVRKNISNYKSH